MALKQLPKLYSTDFRLPNKKPVGDVEIDWSSDLTRGLKLYALLDNPYKITNIAADAVTTSSIGTPSSLVDVNGMSTRLPSGTAIQADIKAINGSAVTMLWYGADTVASGTRGVFTLSDGGSTNRYLVYVATTNWTLFSGTGGGNRLQFSQAASGAPVSNRKNLHIVTLKDGACSWWINGVLQASATTALIAATGLTKIGISCWQTLSTSNGGTQNVGAAGIWDRDLSYAEIKALSDNPYQILKPKQPPTYFTAAAGGTSTLTGTATASITEADIVTGGKTIILTLTGDTYVAAGTGPIGSTADTQALIDGLTSAQSETFGWNAEVRDKEVTTAVVRTSDTVATITLTASASYDITATETITATIPAVALTLATPIVATPTFTVAATGGAATGTMLLRNRLLSNVMLNRGFLQ